MLGLQVVSALRRCPARSLLDLRAGRLRGGGGLHAALPGARVSDLEIELLNYDEEVLTSASPIVETTARGERDRAADPRHPPPRARLREPGRSSSTRASTWTSRSPAPSSTARSRWPTRPASRPAGVHDQALPRRAVLRAAGKDQLEAGDELELNGPYGVFILREHSDGRLLFIGGGAGMAPILVAAELDGRARHRAEGHLLLRGAHRGAICSSSTSSSDLRAPARLPLRPCALGLHPTRSGTARRADHRRRRPHRRRPAATSKATCAGRRR